MKPLRPRRAWGRVLRLCALMSLSAGCHREASQTASVPSHASAVPSPSTSVPAETANPRDARVPEADALACPAPEPRGSSYPPWHASRRFERCIRGPEGRWTVVPDASDGEGFRHVLRFEGVGGQRWEVGVIAPTGLARRVDGHVIVLDLKEGATLVSPTGAVVWRSSFPYCGMVYGVAVGWDGSTTFNCGYSLLRLDPQGKLVWQKWPFGDHGIRGPWVDRKGIVYVAGDGHVAALGPDGEATWRISLGFNRATSDLVWNEKGHLVFDTGMAERHTPESESGMRIYHMPEPNELFEVTREGKIVSRKRYEEVPPPGGWPSFLPVPEDGSHRVKQ